MLARAVVAVLHQPNWRAISFIRRQCHRCRDPDPGDTQEPLGEAERRQLRAQLRNSRSSRVGLQKPATVVEVVFRHSDEGTQSYRSPG